MEGERHVAVNVCSYCPMVMPLIPVECSGDLQDAREQNFAHIGAIFAARMARSGHVVMVSGDVQQRVYFFLRVQRHTARKRQLLAEMNDQPAGSLSMAF